MKNNKIHRFIDISGKRYNRLMAIEYHHTHNRNAYWIFKCICGNEIITEAHSVKLGLTKSCGCLNKEKRFLFGKSRLGKKCMEETKRKMSILATGRKPSEVSKLKMSVAKIGSNHPNWQGGISYFPYSIDWTKTLKRSIRERDKYICQLCSKQQEERAFDVHHIDYDKKNCNPNNLITLCHNCHTKTTFNRDYWLKFFNKKL